MSVRSMRSLIPVMFVFMVAGLFLSQVSPAIQQSILSFGVKTEHAGILELYKDGFFVIASFLIAPHLIRLGDKKIMMIGLVAVALSSIMMPLFPSFTTTQIVFIVLGFSGAVIKISVYSQIGAATHGDGNAHGRYISITEACFSCGMLTVGMLFGYFVDPQEPDSLSWLGAYWVIAFICSVAVIVLMFMRPAETHNLSELPKKGISSMMALLKLPVVYTFVGTVICCVMVEQGVQSWYSSFYNRVIGLPANMSIQMITFFAICIMIGRFLTGYILKFLTRAQLLQICIFGVGAVIVITVVLSYRIPDGVYVQSGDWFNLPYAAYILPISGFFIAPLYPLINSAVLTALHPSQHPEMTALSIMFSALGGGVGSMVIGRIFGVLDGRIAFLSMIIPLMMLSIMVRLLMSRYDKSNPAIVHHAEII